MEDQGESPLKVDESKYEFRPTMQRSLRDLVADWKDTVDELLGNEELDV